MPAAPYRPSFVSSTGLEDPARFRGRLLEGGEASRELLESSIRLTGLFPEEIEGLPGDEHHDLAHACRLLGLHLESPDVLRDPDLPVGFHVIVVGLELVRVEEVRLSVRIDTDYVDIAAHRGGHGEAHALAETVPGLGHPDGHHELTVRHQPAEKLGASPASSLPPE